jgi:hypothetical protein
MRISADMLRGLELLRGEGEPRTATDDLIDEVRRLQDLILKLTAPSWQTVNDFSQIMDDVETVSAEAEAIRAERHERKPHIDRLTAERDDARRFSDADLRARAEAAEAVQSLHEHEGEEQ